MFILDVEDSKSKKFVFKEKRTGFGFLLILPFILLKLFSIGLNNPYFEYYKNANSTRYL